jgi:hypothetical protein
MPAVRIKKIETREVLKRMRLAAALTARAPESGSRCTCSVQRVASRVFCVAAHHKSTEVFPRLFLMRVRGRAVYCADFIPRWTCKRPEGPNPSGPANMLACRSDEGRQR